MTPPEAPANGQHDRSAESAPAVSVLPTAQAETQPPQLIETLRQRADFLRAASARRAGTGGFLLQARLRASQEPVAPEITRVGFTCSKKLGNAVHRNRAKRRLREVARAVLPTLGRAGWDYVLVGRPEATETRDFTVLLDDLRYALREVHSDKPRPPRPPRESDQKGRRRGKAKP